MPTRVKIKILDDKDLRAILDAKFDLASQLQAAEWAIRLAKRIFGLVNYDYESDETVMNGFSVNEKRFNVTARIFDVRQAGFKIHALARNAEEVLKLAFRVAGQSVGTGHMKEHGMVASDYAVKLINLVSGGNIMAVKKERLTQIKELTQSLERI